MRMLEMNQTSVDKFRFILFLLFNIRFAYLIIYPCANLLNTKHDKAIGQYIAHIDLTTPSDHLRMFFHHDPTNMGKKESSVSAIRVRDRICIFVMYPMISHPFENVALK